MIQSVAYPVLAGCGYFMDGRPCPRHVAAMNAALDAKGYPIRVVWCDGCRHSGHVNPKRATPGKRFRCRKCGSRRCQLSLNIAATLEGWYSDHSWKWIFWQNTLFAVPLIACIWYGMPAGKYDRETARQGDYWGMVLGAVGLSLLFAALDQGDRLDWGNSDLIIGLAASGAFSWPCFCCVKPF